MTFRAGKFFMHNQAMDVCVEVVKLMYIGDTYSVWHVRLWNLGYTGKPWIVDENRNYRIGVEQYDNYLELTEEMMLNPRAAGGVPK